MANGVRFGWVGGDGLYGHGYDLSYAVDDLGLTFLFDVHCDQSVYLNEPSIVVPEKTPGRGRTPTRPKTDAQPITVKAYQEGLCDEDWQDVTVRDTTKGVLTLGMHVKRVWVWDKEELQARCWTLIMSRNTAEKKLKYSLSNADMDTTPLQQFCRSASTALLGGTVPPPPPLSGRQKRTRDVRLSGAEMDGMVSSYGPGHPGDVIHCARASAESERLSVIKLPRCEIIDHCLTHKR